MGRIGVTYEEVVEVLERVQSQGKKPTLDNVCFALGRGSRSTVARHLKDWVNQGLMHSSDEGAISPRLLGCVKGLWETLREEMEQKANEYRRASDVKVTDIQQQCTQFQQQNVDLQAHIHQLEEKLHQQTECSHQLQNTLILEQQDNATLTERAASLEAHRQAQQLEIERMHQLVKHLQHNLEHYQAATQQLRQEQTLILEKQRSDYEQKIANLQQCVATLTTEKSLYQAQLEQIANQCEKLQADYHTLNQACQDIQKQHQSVSIAYQVLQQEEARLKQEHHTVTENIAEKGKIVIALQIQLKTTQEKMVSLEKALAKAEDKIQALRQDYSFAAQEKAHAEGQLKQLQQHIVKNSLVKTG